ncbi:hypothetical protein GGR92_001463 [Spirosoma lacussanchae]|uniref:carboxypeptidase regulatory-like domain-containing protein n=1 Tax=Spirosoma lacussanchae TaxID=1884249 RepID=UPI0011084243|nr:carboxypeptidase regulatory-like domain-containing protein [Spirosoma lacussanchae]
MAGHSYSRTIAFLAVGLLLLVRSGLAQTTSLSGRVTDAATGKPLPFASVYLNATTRGTTTDEQGRFDLPNVPLGTIEVVSSFLGYQTARQTLRLDQARPATLAFALTPDSRVLADVTVRANRKNRTWERQFRQFRRQLLGDPFGSQCQITNSFVLSFTEEKGHLIATATAPLIIENQALGYRLYYDLQRFDGSLVKVYYAGASRFEPLTPADDRQAERYHRNRMQAYLGSLRHLMASLISGTHEQNDFQVYYEDITKPMGPINGQPLLYEAIHKYKRLTPVTVATLIQPGRLPFERRLETARPLVVFYTRATSTFSPYRDARYAYSQLTLPQGWSQLATDGLITVPNGLEASGSLADDRLSTQMPADWKLTGLPGQTQPGDEASQTFITQGKLLPPDQRLERIAADFTSHYGQLGPTAYAHIDKPFYLTGDRLWFSVYLLDTPTHRRPAGETAAQADLLTPSGQLVQHQWLHVAEGRGVGNFRLSDTLGSGLYRLRVYTDEDDRQFRPAFERSVAIYNALDRSARPARETAMAKQVVAEPARTNGLSLSVDLSTDTSRLAITMDGGAQQRPDSVYLLIQQRGQLVDQQKVLLQAGRAQLSIPVLRLPPGLVQLRLYNDVARLQAERLVVVPDRLPPVAVTMTTPKARYQPRESVSLTISLNDGGRPAVAALSVSITDADQVPPDTAADDLPTHLFLTGELSEPIRLSNDYLKTNRPDLHQRLSQQLARQQWRRMGGIHDAGWLGGVSIMGQVLNAAGLPIPDAQLVVASTSAAQYFVNSVGADQQGRFRLAGLAVKDTLPLLVQFTDRQFKSLPVTDTRLVLQRPGMIWPRTSADTLVDWERLSAVLAAARLRQEADPGQYRQKAARQLAEVNVSARKQADPRDAVRGMSLHGKADATVTFSGNTTQFSNLYEMMRGQVSGVSVMQLASSESSNGYAVTIRGINSLQSSTEPLYLMDGMPITGDPSTALFGFSPNDIERIEVLKNAGSVGMYGVRGGNGVIAFYSKRSASEPSGPGRQKTAQSLQLIGYPSVPPAFTVPRYEAGVAPAEGSPVDRRDVLYWKPIAQTDSNGQTRLLFPLSDVVRTVRVTVQGITQDGRPVAATQLIQVQ